MKICHIKYILIGSIVWIIVTQMLYVVVLQSQSHLAYALSLLGQCAFLAGLVLLDRRAKSMLSSYYAVMVCISLILYILRYLDMNNIFVSLVLVGFFLFALYQHVRIFTRISGQTLFVRSFYVLMLCMILGFAALISSSLARSPQIAPLVVGAMVLPALFIYLVALFSLERVSLEKINKVGI